MSQTKNTRSKRKPLPNEITISLKTPKARQYLFPSNPASNNKRDVDSESEPSNVKKSKKKKLRRTQNYLNYSNESNRESSSSISSLARTKSTGDSEVDGDISTELSEGKSKSKTRKKKMKLPIVSLDDFGSPETTLRNVSHEKKNHSVESLDSLNNVFDEKKMKNKSKKKRKSRKQEENEDELLVATRSSRKTRTIDENKENILETEVGASKKKRRNRKMDLTDTLQESEENDEKIVKKLRSTSKRTILNSEVVDESEEQTSDNFVPSKSRKKRTEIVDNPEDLQDKIEESVSLKRTKRKKQAVVLESEEENKNVRKSKRRKHNSRVTDVEDKKYESLQGNLSAELSNGEREMRSLKNSRKEYDETFGFCDDIDDLNIRKTRTPEKSLREPQMVGLEENSVFMENEIVNEEDVEKNLRSSNRISRIFNGQEESHEKNNSICCRKSRQTSKKSGILEGDLNRSNIRKSINSRKSLLSSEPQEKLQDIDKVEEATSNSDTPEESEDCLVLRLTKDSDEDLNISKTLVPNLVNSKSSEESEESTVNSKEEKVSGSAVESTNINGKSQNLCGETVDLDLSGGKNFSSERRVSLRGSRTSRMFSSSISKDKSEVTEENVEKMECDTSLILNVTDYAARNSRTPKKDPVIKSPRGRSLNSTETIENLETSLRKSIISEKMGDVNTKGADCELENPGKFEGSTTRGDSEFLVKMDDVPNRSKGRKRWTILNGENISNGKKEGDFNKTISGVIVDSQVRRSTRKRWSTELKKKTLNPSDLEIKEVFNSPGNKRISKKASFKIGVENRFKSSSRSLSRNSAASSMKDASVRLDPSLSQNQSACLSLNDTEKVNETFSLMETCNNIKPDESLKRTSKRYSKSLDSLEGISPLAKSSTFGEDTLKEHPSKNSGNSKPSTPASILKRRDTYDVDVSVTDVSILKSLSEGNLSTSVLDNDRDHEKPRKSVKFQHVTRRRVNVDQCDQSNQSITKKPELITKKLQPKFGAANKSVSFDHTMFSASSCSTSTPLHPLRKDTLLKQTLKNNLGGASGKRRSRSAESAKNKVVSRIKMPNFSKIHQRWNDKFEDIAQMTARKAERAKLLLSGQKPTSTSISNDSRKINDDVKHPKRLNFANQSSSNKSLGDKKGKDTPIESKKKPALVVNQVKSNAVALSGIPRKIEVKKTTNVVQRSQEIKSLVTKSKPQHDAKEERRNILKGVRGNRRFELLMKMRNK